jgi:4-hydroxythreonine-4-phosphate dehydrogenase
MKPSVPPVVLLTCGDPAGIGPEVLVRAWQATAAHGRARLRVVADADLLRRSLAGRRGVTLPPVEVVGPDDGRPSTAERLLVVDPRAAGLDRGAVDAAAAAGVRPGVATAAGAAAAADAVLAAAEFARSGRARAIVTGPLNKATLKAAGHDVPGHTELLARAAGLAADAVSMMLWLPRAGGSVPGAAAADSGGAAGLGVVHVTLHEPLARAVARITTAGIVAAGERLAVLLEALLGRRPRIAVAALNPHAGEDGLFGDEEERIVAPAVRRLRELGRDASGPLPADTLFLRAAAGGFDGVVALYHDQGHIPVKLLGMHRAVNITLGLPFVRTSVAHGTASDIVGTGAADPASMIAAIDAAVRLVEAGWPAAAVGPDGAG